LVGIVAVVDEQRLELGGGLPGGLDKRLLVAAEHALALIKYARASINALAPTFGEAGARSIA
jgi:hypothetical protein